MAKTMASLQAFPSSLLPRAPLAFLSRLKLPFPKLPFPSPSNACHAGYMVPSTLDIACVAWRFCRAGRRSGVATKNSRAKRARTSGEAARKIWGYAFSFLREGNQSCLSGICFLRADIFMAHFIKITFTALSEERNFLSFIVFSIRSKESRLNGV